MDYKTTTHDYLKRARFQLDSGTKAGIFYAALELRFGIESRMYRYLQARENITKLKRRGWRIAKMAAQIESTFSTKGKMCVVILQDKSNRLKTTEFRYIPISNKLKIMAEKLGDYLHAQELYRHADDMWWSKTRKYLESVYNELEYISSGTLMGAPLLNPKKNQFHLEIELPREDVDKLELLNNSFREIREINVKVTYLEREARHNKPPS